MNLHIAICDDDPDILEELTKTLWRFQIATNHNLKIDPFSSGERFLEKHTTSDDYQILFLDVEMPEKNGLEIAGQLRSRKEKDLKIVFVSNYPKYMQDSFRVHPFYYLQKPLNDQIIFDVMTQIIEEIQDQHTMFTMIQVDDREIAINTKDIQYIIAPDSKNQKVCFHLLDEEFSTKGKISDWAKKLEKYGFMLCQRNLLVNLSYIHYFSDTHIVLQSGEQLSISRRNRKRIQELYLNHVVEHRRLP